MRGKDMLSGHRTVIGRITPAYAGKSGNAGGRCQLLQDHPRLCGEKVVLRWIRAVD